MISNRSNVLNLRNLRVQVEKVQGPPTHIDAFQRNIFSWFNDFWDREIKRFDIKRYFSLHQPHMASRTSERDLDFWIFQICRDCDHETICIPKLNVLYQISLSEDFKNIFFFIIMSSNHEKMFVWNASIWVGGPCSPWFSLITYIVGSLINVPYTDRI